jgi:hypothetical protein
MENEMKLIIAGYTAAPTDRAAAEIYYDQLLKVSGADGLEFAWSGPQTPEQLASVVKRMPNSWTLTLNDIPAVYRASVNLPKFGLASPDEGGREAAIAMLGEIRDGIRRLNDIAGRPVVMAAEIHTAPGFDHRVLSPDPVPLRRSLEWVLTQEWGGAEVMVEHCDAFIEGQKPAKGFLRLGEELQVLSSLPGTPLGMSLNFGRSVIEFRDPDRVGEHFAEAEKSGLLRAITFSGTAGTDNTYGVAWADSHLPFAETLDPRYAEPASLMTPARVASLLRYVQGCRFVAVKTQWPAKIADPLERAASVIANFETFVSLLNRDALRR